MLRTVRSDKVVTVGISFSKVAIPTPGVFPGLSERKCFCLPQQHPNQIHGLLDTFR